MTFQVLGRLAAGLRPASAMSPSAVTVGARSDIGSRRKQAERPQPSRHLGEVHVTRRRSWRTVRTLACPASLRRSQRAQNAASASWPGTQPASQPSRPAGGSAASRSSRKLSMARARGTGPSPRCSRRQFAVPVGGVDGAQVAERRLQFGGQLLPPGARGRLLPGKVSEPTLGERAQHALVGAVLGPEPHRRLDVVIPDRADRGFSAAARSTRA